MSSTHRPACMLSLCLAVLAAAPAVADDPLDVEIWDLEAVDADGKGVHEALASTALVTFEAVCLNAPEDMLNTEGDFGMWQVYVQGLATNPAPYNQGGIALWAGAFFPDYPPYTGSLSPGDHVQVTGYVGDHNGKVNCNSRHGMVDQFQVTLLGHVGMPQAQVIPSIADCNDFDTTDSDSDGVVDRATGGDRWQGQWCQLKGVRLVDPSAGWANGTAVPITDASAGTLDMFCGDVGNFDTTIPPPGKFNLTAIFDQEDTSGEPYHAGYRMWPLAYNTTHFLLWGDADTDGDVDILDAGDLLDSYTGDGGSGMTWAQGDFNTDGDVDILDAGDLLANYTGTGGGPPLASAGVQPGTAAGTYDPATGEILLSADGIEFLYVYAEGLLTGEDPNLSFLTGGFVTDDSDDLIGFWAMNNPQTFADASLGNVAALGLGEGDLTLTYQAGLTAGQVKTSLTILPEPASLALAGLGLTTVLLRRKSRE